MHFSRVVPREHTDKNQSLFSPEDCHSGTPFSVKGNTLNPLPISTDQCQISAGKRQLSSWPLQKVESHSSRYSHWKLVRAEGNSGRRTKPTLLQITSPCQALIPLDVFQSYASGSPHSSLGNSRAIQSLRRYNPLPTEISVIRGQRTKARDKTADSKFFPIQSPGHCKSLGIFPWVCMLPRELAWPSLSTGWHRKLAKLGEKKW